MQASSCTPGLMTLCLTIHGDSFEEIRLVVGVGCCQQLPASGSNCCCCCWHCWWPCVLLPSPCHAGPSYYAPLCHTHSKIQAYFHVAGTPRLLQLCPGHQRCCCPHPPTEHRHARVVVQGDARPLPQLEYADGNVPILQDGEVGDVVHCCCGCAERCCCGGARAHGRKGVGCCACGLLHQ